MSRALVTEQLLTDIADAVREVSGHDFSYALSELPEEIREYGGGKPWTRPDGWPNYDYYIKRCGADMDDVLYLTCLPVEDNSEVSFTVAASGGYTVERGTVDADGFTAMSSETVESDTEYSTDLGTDDEIVMLRITGVDGTITQIFSTNSTEYGVDSPIVEIWGRMASQEYYAYGLALNSLRCVDITGNVRTDLISAFLGCTAIEWINAKRWDTSAVTSMQNMFYNCSSLTELDVSGWDVSNVTSFYRMFRYCSSLTTLNIAEWNISTTADVEGMFLNMTALTDFYPPTMYNSFELSNSSGLSTDSIQRVIDCLAEVEETQTLTLHSTTKAALTDEQIETATEKGWTIA